MKDNSSGIVNYGGRRICTSATNATNTERNVLFFVVENTHYKNMAISTSLRPFIEDTHALDVRRMAQDVDLSLAEYYQGPALGWIWLGETSFHKAMSRSSDSYVVFIPHVESTA